MEKKVLLSLAGVIALLLIFGLFTKKNLNLNTPTKKTTQVTQKTVTINNKKVDVEIANTEALRKKGLGGRSSLGADTGMLFVFATEGDAPTKPVTPIFWMKDMLIPIDIIWIKNNKIAKIDKNVPFYPKDTPDNQLKVYAPTQSIDYVLEVNSGFSEKFDFKVEDVVTLPAL